MNPINPSNLSHQTPNQQNLPPSADDLFGDWKILLSDFKREYDPQKFDMGLECLFQAADMGHPEACNELADYYVNPRLLGLNISVSYKNEENYRKLAIEVLEKTNPMDTTCETRLMWLYLRKEGSPEEEAKGMKILEKLAATNDNKAITFAEILIDQARFGSPMKNVSKEGLAILEKIIEKKGVDPNDKTRALYLLRDSEPDRKKVAKYDKMLNEQRTEEARVTNERISKNSRALLGAKIAKGAKKVALIALAVFAVLAVLGAIAALIWFCPPAGAVVLLAVVGIGAWIAKGLGHR